MIVKVENNKLIFDEKDNIKTTFSNENIIKILLENRFINDENKKQFLESFDIDDINPYEFIQMEESVELISKKIKTKSKIGIYGDFDADGLTGTAILLETLRTLGADPKPFIPHRENEGHGISEKGLNTLVDIGCELIITVDTGTNSDQIIEKIINEKNIDFVITDHHIPEKSTYKYPIINPVFENIRTNYSGAGVAWLLSKALFDKFEIPMKDGITSLATIGTIADVAPLLENNRIIVKNGLKEISETDNFGICALNILVGNKFFYEPPESEYISFSLAPRINTPGRIDDAYLALNLLTSQNSKSAHNISQKIEVMNDKRKSLSQELWNEIQDQISFQYTQPIIILNCSGYPLGLLGPLAGRLVDQLSKPILCFAEKDDLYKFSSRSYDGYHLFDNLSKLQSYFINFGGHASAAGFSIRSKDFDSFKKDLLSLDSKNKSKKSEKKYTVDLELPITNLNFQLWNEIKKLSPFGEKNPVPVFFARNASLEKFRRIGKDKNHMSGQINNDNNTFDFIYFNCGEKRILKGKINFLYQLRTDYWNGKIQKKIQILEMENSE